MTQLAPDSRSLDDTMTAPWLLRQVGQDFIVVRHFNRARGYHKHFAGLIFLSLTWGDIELPLVEVAAERLITVQEVTHLVDLDLGFLFLLHEVCPTSAYRTPPPT